MRLTLSLLILSLGSVLLAQQNRVCTLNFKTNDDGTGSTHMKKRSAETPYTIHTFQFYVSNIQLFNESELVHTCEKTAFLVDVFDSESLSLIIEMPYRTSYTHIKFNIGVDSVTNVSGALGNDLDPTKGMYWTWQSGYINFKIEGSHVNCPSRNNQFQFHLGGYRHPFNALQTVQLSVKNSDVINIGILLDAFFDHIDIRSTHHVMSPTNISVQLSNQLPKLFTVL